MNKNKTKVGIISLLPGVIMIILMVIAFKSSNMDFGKQFSIMTIILINPLLFILQGAFAGVLRVNIILTTMCSIIGFLVCVFVFLNNSALPYVVFYGGLELLAYYLVKSMKYKSS